MDPVALLVVALSVVVYSWTFYNLPVLLTGLRRHVRENSGTSHGKGTCATDDDLPTFSVVVPAKNEESVLSRLLDALLHQNYPKGKFEVILVEDGSTDATLGICERYASANQERVRLVHGGSSSGKPSALNRALTVSKGDIVCVFDADNVPEQDALLNAAGHFRDKSVAALQGRVQMLNSEVNMLTKFVSYEEAAWCEGYLNGKDALGLFVHLRGSCQFMRRSVLESLGGWSDRHLSEDMEISARLTERGCRIKYASDVCSWQESPESLVQMFRQRIRWYRGSMEVALKYGRLIRKPSFRTLDAEATLLGPFVLIVSFLSYLLGPLVFASLDGSVVWLLTFGGWAALTTTFAAGAVGLLSVARPKRKRDVLWLPFIYAYWSFQVLLATCALLKIVFGAPREWKRTPRTGTIASADSSLCTQIKAHTSDREATAL